MTVSGADRGASGRRWAAQARGVAGQVRARRSPVSTAEVISRAIRREIRREIRRRAAERDAQIYAASADPDLESDAYALWAARSAGQVWSELD